MVHSDDDAGVLDRAVFIEEQRAYRADVGAQGVLGEALEPVWRDDVGVVVEEDEYVSARVARAEVVDLRIIKLSVIFYDIYRRMFLKSLIVLKGPGLGTVILYDDYLVILIRRSCGYRIYASSQILNMILVRDEY